MQTATTERRGRGRPPKGAPKSPRVQVYSFSLSQESADLIERLADRLGISKSAAMERAAHALAENMSQRAA